MNAAAAAALALALAAPVDPGARAALAEPVPIPIPIEERQHAPPDSWAAHEGGTRGGALANPVHVYTVSDRAQLVAALGAAAPARIVRVAALIDMSEGRPYLDSADQARRGRVAIGSHTTVLGVAPGAGFVNASLVIDQVEQVIVRNLAIRNPCDVNPRWDPRDGAGGNWNSEFDGISVRDARHVWIDHNSFTDAPDTDEHAPIENGKRKQCHDGALDITQGSDLVGVTYNRFAQHEKTMLIGASDRATADQGRLRVTLKGNLFEHVAERAPRVRYGQVHLFNNLYLGERPRAEYGHGYSIGVGHAATIVSDANAFEVVGASTCRHLVRDPGSSPGVFSDKGSLLNGQPLADCPFAGDLGPRIAYAYSAMPAALVASHVRANAGPRAASASAGGGAEARLIPAPGAPFVLRARRDANGDWQGASLQLTDGGKTLQIEMLESRGGAVRRLKQVRRRSAPSSAPLSLGLVLDAGQLTVLLDGERVTTSLATPLAARQPLDWEPGAHRLLDVRGMLASAERTRVTAQVAQQGIALQAGDPPQVVRFGGEGEVIVGADDARVAVVEHVDGALRLTPLAAGKTVITLRSARDPWAQAQFDVVVGPRHATPPPAVRSAPSHPRSGERGVPPDTLLRLTLPAGAALTQEGSIRVWRTRDRHLAAIVRAGETVTAIGPAPRQRLVRQHQLRIIDGELQARLPQALDYDTEYEVVAEGALVSGAPFAGARWRFHTTAQRPVGDSITVGLEGRTHFRTVQGALDYAMSLPRAAPITINVRDGVYRELLYLRDKDNLTLRGQSRAATIIRAANSDTLNPGSGTGQAPGEPGLLGGRALFLAQDSDLLEIRDITLHNSTLRLDGHSPQAETLFFSSQDGRLMVRNAHFLSEQDTLQLTGYAWFYKSLIEGNVDFIWGNNRVALFEDSEIRSIGDSANPDSGGYIVQARTVGAMEPGFIFLRSKLTHGAGPAGNLPASGSAYLARSPGTVNTWDKVAFIDCEVGPHIAYDGWLRKPMPNPAQGGWREYGNRGPDGQPRSYGGMMLSAAQARLLANRATVFSGRGWHPQP